MNGADASDERQERLEGVLGELAAELERGRQPSIATLVELHPDFHAEIISFVAEWQQLALLFDPFRPRSKAVPDRIRYFGDYELEEEIGRGGMGVVYKAKQVSLNRTVAVKMILSGELVSQNDVSRFHAEAQAAAALEHPGIVSIYEVGEHAGQHFFSMAYVEGESLAARLVRGTLPAREAAETVMSLAHAIHYAHQKGVIHRDLKPSNILIESGGLAKIVDFGLAKSVARDYTLTSTGAIVGTPSYMSPEQASAEHQLIGPASDVYSLGSVLYSLLTGDPPFRASSVAETLRQVLECEPSPLRSRDATIPRDLDTICLKCLQKEPTRRYASAQKLADDLSRFLQGRPVEARPIGKLERSWRWCKRNPRLAVVVTTLLLVLLGVAIVAPAVALTQVALRKRADELAEEQRELIGDLEKAVAQGTAATTEADRQRVETEKARTAQETARQLAESRLAEQYLSKGMECCERGDSASGLLWLVRSLELVPAESVALAWYVRANLSAWDSYTARLILRVEEHQSEHLAVSPDGGTIAIVRKDGSIELWDAATGNRIDRTLRNETGCRCATFSPDNKTFLTGGYDGTVRLWDWTKGEQLCPPLRHRYLENAKFSPNGERVLTTGMARQSPKGDAKHGDFALWDATTGRAVGSKIRPQRHVFGAGFSPSGQTLLIQVSASDGTNLRMMDLWDATKGTLIGEAIPHNTDRWYPTYTSDGRFLAAAPARDSIQLWEAATGKPGSHSLQVGEEVARLVLSSDGTSLVVWFGSRTKEKARLWDGRTGRAIGDPLADEGRIQVAAFSRDGRMLITGGPDRVARLWDVATAGAIGQPLPHNDFLHEVAFDADGKTVWTSAGGAWRVWRADSQRPVHQQPCPHYGRWRPQNSPRMNVVLTRTQTDGLQLWDLEGGGPIGDSFGKIVEWEGAPRYLSHGKVVVGSRSRIDVWQPAGGPDALIPAALPAAFSPDGSRVAASRSLRGDESGVRWDTVAGGLVDRTRQLARGGAQVWDTNTGEPLAGPVHDRAIADSLVTALAFSPDGTMIAAGDEWRTARIWSVPSGEVRGAPLEHTRSVSRVAFKPDGKSVLTVSDRVHGGIAQVWDVSSGKPIGRPLQHCRGPVAFCPDGKYVAVQVDGGVRLWDPTGGNAVDAVAIAGGVEDVAFSPDGHTVAVAGSSQVSLWKTEGMKLIGPPTCFKVKDSSCRLVAFSREGKTLAVATDLGVELWDFVAGKRLGDGQRIAGWGEALALSSDGKTVLTGRGVTAQVWDVATGEPRGQGLEHHQKVQAAAFSPDGRQIVTACGHKPFRSAATTQVDWPLPAVGARIQVWETDTGRPVGPAMRQSFEHLPVIRAIAFNPDGKTFATGGSDLVVRLWDATTGKAVGQALPTDSFITTVAFSPDGKTLLTAGYRGSDDGIAQLWDVASGQRLADVLAFKRHLFAGFMSDGTPVVAEGKEDRGWAEMHLWNVATGRPVMRPLRYQGNSSQDFEILPGRKMLLTVRLFGLKVWDIAAGQCVRTFDDAPYSQAAAVSADGNRIVVFGGKALTTWDVESDTTAVRPWQQTTLQGSVSPDGETVAVTGHNGTVQLWHAPLGRPIGPPLQRHWAKAAEFSPDGGKIMVGPDHGPMRICRAPSPFSGPPRDLMLWAQVRTGMELRDDGAIQALDAATWQERSRLLANTLEK